MSRELMPKSGIMMPHVVVTRDAAVVGVSTVDGQAGAVNLTDKYLQKTDAAATYQTKVEGASKDFVLDSIQPIMSGALFREDPWVVNDTPLRSTGANGVESVDMMKVTTDNSIKIGSYASSVQGVEIHSAGRLQVVDQNDSGVETKYPVYSKRYRPEIGDLPFAAIGSYVKDSKGRTVGVTRTGINSDIKQLTQKVTFTQPVTVPDAVGDYDAVTLRQLHNSSASLSSPSGITHVGNGYGYYDTITTATASQFKDGMLVTFKGRDVANDGGGGVFRYTSDETLEANGGTVFAVSGGGRLIRQVQTSLSENQISEAINVRWFGAKGDAATDDTAAILNAYNFAKSTNLFYTLLFPAGRYVTLTSFVFQDVTNCSFVMDGAVFIGGSNGADNSQQSVFEIRNVVAASISGPWAITTKPQTGPVLNNPNAYISGFLVRGVPGGILQPTLGVCAFFSVNDLTTIRIGNGIRVGEINNDAQTSEMQFVNCKTPATVNPVQVAGSQTLVSFVGCTLASNDIDGITNAQKTTIINSGGAVSIEGGSVEQHSDSSTQMILMGPCFSPTYGNPYGQVAMSGAVIETIAPICNISNSFSYSSPASYNSKLSIIGCTGGYIGSVPETSSLINVFDTEYAGVIAVPDGSLFYAQLTSPPRTGYNINASGNSKVRIVVGKTVFDTATGLRGYQAGVAGGVMIHPEVLATAANVTSQAIPSGVVTPIVWGSNPEDSVRMGRYHNIVNTSTGEITIPDAGIKSMRVEAAVTLDSGTIVGNLMLYRNGSLYQYGVLSVGAGLLNVTIDDPIAGDVFTVCLLISAPSALINITKMNIYLTT